MISRKMYPCEKCGRFVAIRSKGLCGVCTSKSKPLKRTPIKKSNPNKHKLRTEKRKSFFIDCINSLPKYSYESKKYLGSLTTTNICHVFPKSKFPSVEFNKDNIVVLSIEEHYDFDYYINNYNKEALLVHFPRTIGLLRSRATTLIPNVTESGSLSLFLTDLLLC